MQETSNYRRYILILTSIIVVLVISYIIIRLIMNSRRPPTTIQPTPTTQTNNAPTITTYPSQGILPTLPEGETRTGGNTEPLSTAEATLSDQKTKLLDKLPINEPAFTITMDYNDGKFLVELTEPKTNNKTLFASWLKNNYPAIPIDRFKFQ